MRQLAIKEDFASEAKKHVDDLLWRSLAALADYISDPPDTLLVFNPLSWQRSSLVEIDLDNGLELVDLTNHQTVPYEILSTGAGLPPHPFPGAGRALAWVTRRTP